MQEAAYFSGFARFAASVSPSPFILHFDITGDHDSQRYTRQLALRLQRPHHIAALPFSYIASVLPAAQHSIFRFQGHTTLCGHRLPSSIFTR